jgi:hypothetical protein
MAVMPMSDDFDQKVTEFFRTYQDRGMKKWAGFFLSDHTLKINQDKAKRSVTYQKEKPMSQAEISEVLFKAFSNHLLVQLQLKQLDDNGELPADITGFVEGYQEQKIIISGQVVDFNDINHVDLK